MSSSHRMSQFSDLLQRVTGSCLLHPFPTTVTTRFNPPEEADNSSSDTAETEVEAFVDSAHNDQEEDKLIEKGTNSNNGARADRPNEATAELAAMMGDVFEAVSSLKRAYTALQSAHSPWDPEQMREADAAVVTELRRIGAMRERFRRGFQGRGLRAVGVETGRVREMVAPYEAAMEELKREVRDKEAEIERLKERVNGLLDEGTNGIKGKKGHHHHHHQHHQSRRKLLISSSIAAAAAPTQVSTSPSPDLFEAAMGQVTETTKSFTSLLLSLMRSAHWDIAAAVRSISVAASNHITTAAAAPPPPPPTAAKYALESYVSRKIFQGFDHETFYMDGTLSSLLNPDQFRRDCYSKYRDMKSMDPAELLGILPTCQFGVFCNKRYLSIVHPKMEESLFGGDLEQHRQVSAGNHPRTEFYGEFLEMAKAVWLLHLLAFSLDQPPSHFEASRGSEFHPGYMESVVRFPGGKVPLGHVVGFSVGPGFKLGRGSVIKTRVYLVPKS